MRAMSTRLVVPAISMHEYERQRVASPPAGEATRECRELHIKRIAFAAAIKHGTKLSALADVFVDLVHAEAELTCEEVPA